MVITFSREVDVRAGQYWLAEVSLSETDPKHREIVYIDHVDEHDGNFLFAPITCVGQEQWDRKKVKAFRFIEKIDM